MWNYIWIKRNGVFRMNKRGSIEIVLLVVLVLLVTSATLFSFVTNSDKVGTKISDTNLESVSLKKNLAEFYLVRAGENAIVKTYKEFVDDGSYINNPIRNSEGEVEFGELHIKLNENFRDKFLENFKAEFGGYDFERDYLKNLKEIVVGEDLHVSLEKDILIMIIDGFEVRSAFKDINVTYTPRLSLTFGLREIGLHSFDEIYEVKEECKTEENVIECYGSLANFETTIVEKEKSTGGEYSLVTCTTKKSFLIDGGFNNLGFSFVMK